jgi:N-acyl-phosphatidylethanolamine-hydrolysing phospholipase D
VTADSPQRKGHRFENPWPGFEKHGFRDAVKWMLQRRANSAPNAGEATPPKRVRSTFPVPRSSPDELTATWVGHTTVLLQIGGLNILTDPIWSDRASPLSFAGPKRLFPPGLDFDALPIIDVVVISHDHYDHLDAETVKRLVARFPAAAWRVPLGVGEFLRKRGAIDVQELTWHQSTQIGRVRLICVPAQHFSGRGLFNRNETLWCGWVLSVANRSVFFAGDTAFNPSFADIGRRYGPFDLALIPIGAYDPRWFMASVHMDPEESVEAVKMLAGPTGKIPHVFATHWGTFKLTDEPMDEPRLRMTTAWSRSALAAEWLWILDFGETRTL